MKKIFLLFAVLSSFNASAEIYIANPFSKPHCFKIDNAKTTHEGAKAVISAYEGKAKIISEKIYNNQQPEIIIDIPHEKSGSYPIVIMSSSLKECTVWISKAQKSMK